MLQRFGGLFLLPLFTSYLTPAEYGVFALLTILGALAKPIFDLGINAAMGPSYFKATQPDEKDQVIWSALTISIISASCLLLVSWLNPHLLIRAVLIDEAYLRHTSLFLTGVAATIVLTPLVQKIQFAQRAKLFVLLQVASTIVFVVASILSVVIHRRGVLGMVEAQLASNLSALLLFAFFALPRSNPLKINRKVTLDILKTGLPLVPSFALLFIMANAGRYVVQWHDGEAAVGVYSVGFQIGSAINLLIGALATGWYPFFMAYLNRQAEAQSLFGRITTFYLLGIGFLCLLIFSWATVVVRFLLDEAFHQAAEVVGLISLAYAFTGFFNLLLPPIYFAQKIPWVVPIQALAALVSILLAITLCPLFGNQGAALSLLGGHCSMALGVLLLNQHNSHLKFKIKYQLPVFFRFIPLFIAIVVISQFLAHQSSLINPLLLTAFSLLATTYALTPMQRSHLAAFLKNPIENLRRH